MYTSSLTVTQNVLVNVAQVYSSVGLRIKHSRLLSPHTQPDMIKTYPVRPDLSDNRIFIPRAIKAAHASGTAPKIPVVISAHGSAWIVGNPSGDDNLNRFVADHAGVVVVGINYGKAPQHPFPEGFEDIIALVNAVIEDTELPIDPTRVVLCGGSAGANLVLGAAQDPRVQGKAKGIVAICPPVDMVTSKDDKMATRPHPETKDVLAPLYNTILDTYLGAEKDTHTLTDSRLSPIFFKDRSLYPENMYLIGFEDDLLCHEDEMMAEKLADGQRARKEITERGWKCGNVTWEKIADSHGFMPTYGESAEHKVRREEEHDALYERIAAWVRNVLGSSPDLLEESELAQA